MVGYEAIKFKQESNFNKLEIIIVKDPQQRPLLDREEVLLLMKEHLGFDPSVANINEVDFRALEESLEANPYIKAATIYLNARHELKVTVEQRKPIARVKSSHVDYYVATDGQRIPLSKYATLRVPIVTGYVGLISGKTEESEDRYEALTDLLNRCGDDKFLTALIEQIDIASDGKVTIIPKLGKERIVFGELEDTEEKLLKLSKYYEWGRQQDGWDRFAYLNLEVPNQIALGKAK